MKFKLKGGQHEDGNKKTYKSGDIVESPLELDKLFRGKFTRIPSAEDFDQPSKDSENTKPNIPIPPADGTDKEDTISESVPSEDIKEDGENKDNKNDKEEDNEDKKDLSDNVTKYGKDVTADFPKAVALEIKIYVRAAWHIVVDGETNEVLNERKLRANQIDDFLIQYEPQKS